MMDLFPEFDAALKSIHTEPFAKTTAAGAPLTAAQMEAFGTALVDGILAQVLLAVANITIFGQKPFIGLQAWATELETAASNALATAEGAQTTATTANTNAQTALNQWAATLDGLLGTGSDITDFVEWLDGSASGAMLTGVSSSTITAANAQLLGNPNFSGVISLDGNGIWTYDSTVYYTQVGVVAPGSAKVTANGVLQAITSDQAGSIANPIPLGQPLDYSVQVLTSGLTGTGTLLQLLAVPWIGNAQQTPVVIASGGIPAGVNTTWTNPPSGSHAATLSGSYSPATGSGITSVQMRLAVTANATAGTVWYSAASEELTGGLIATLQSDFTAGNTAFSTLWTSWETAVAGYSSWSTFIAAMESAYSTYITTTTALTAGEFATLQQLIGSFFGIDTSTGFLPQTQVSGLTTIWDSIFGTTTPASGQQVLQTAVADLSDAWTALFGSSSTPTSGSQVLQTAVQDLDNAWTALFGSSSAPATSAKVLPASVSNVLGGANLGVDVTSVHTTASNGSAWATRLTNDLLVTSDVFHLKYAVGTSTDPPGTLSGGKPTWYSCWNDILELTGTVNATTAPTDAAPQIAAAVTTAQSTADGASSDAGSALSQLTAVPQQNVVPLNVDTGQPVALVSSGAGATGTGTGSQNINWTDTIPSTANYLLMLVNTATTHGISGINAFVSSGSDVKQLSTAAMVPYSSSGTLVLLALPNPPTGSVTLQVEIKDGTSLFSMVSATAMSFSNVVSISVAATNEANNSNATLSTSFSSGKLVVNAIGSFGTASSNVGLSSYNRTQQYHAGNFNGGSQFNMDLLAGTVSGVTSPTFTATVATTTNEAFASLAVALNAPPNILGSYARVYRNATSAATRAVSVDQSFGTGTAVFDTTQEYSSDITVDLSTAKFTVSYSGTYLFKIGVAFTGVYSTQTVDGLCYVNGQLFERSAQFWYASSSQTRLAWATPVYLNAGDYIQPGMTWGSTSIISMVGESTGTQTYMSLSLLNRSLL